MSNQSSPESTETRYAVPLLQNEVYRYKNKTAADIIIPYTFATILGWGCPKRPTQTFKDFLMEKYPGEKWNSYSKRWTDSDLQKLDESDCSKLDVTILFKLIQEVCDTMAYFQMKKLQDSHSTDGRAISFDEITKTKLKMVELLDQAKDIRNEDSHSPGGAAISSTTLSDVRDVAQQLLCKGAEIYNIEDNILKSAIEAVNKSAELTIEVAMTEKERRLNKLKERICKEGRRDIEKTVIKEAIDKLPFSGIEVVRRDVFHPCGLLVQREVMEDDQDEEESQEANHELLCENFLGYRKDENIIISGHPGSGKSTLLRRLREDFLLKIPKMFSGLECYELLLYMECRDSTKTISELVKKNFTETFASFEDESDVLEILGQLKMLICVDGIDEANEFSSLLLNDLIDQFGHNGRASFIFTSRPGSSDELKQELRDKHLTYFSVSIQPLESENEKVCFLRRFQENVLHANASELIETFQRLEPLCKECLVHPVYLTLFCHFFVISPQAVKEWKSELDVMDHIWKISKESVQERLTLENVTGDQNETLLSNLMDEIRNLTVLLLMEDKLVIDQRTYVNLCRHTFGDRDVSYHKIISCILVSESHQTSFTFLHKSHAEFLAANAVLARLEKDPKSLFLTCVVRIAGDYRASLQRGGAQRVAADNPGCSSSDPAAAPEDIQHKTATLFSNVFRFTILILVEQGKNDVIQRIFQETGPILVRAKTPFSYWVELTLSCRSCELVVKEAADAAKRAKYSVLSVRHMMAATLMLRYHQPEVLTVSLTRTQEPTPALRKLMGAVAEHHTGRLRLLLPYSYYESSCDDYVLELLASSKVQLTQFQGCLNSRAAVQSLAALFSRAEKKKKKKGSKEVMVSISLPDPSQHHLAELGRVTYPLEVRAQATDSVRCTRPLPLGTGTPPALTLVCGPNTTIEQIAVLAENLAPKEQRYSSLLLQNWHGIDGVLDQLVADLAAAGIQTKQAPTATWSPARTVAGLCKACGEDHQREPSEEDGRCVELKLPDSRVNWTVTCHHSAAGVTEALRHRQPRLLDVTMPREAGSPPTLKALVETAAELHTRLLKLILQHSYIDCFPVDEYIRILGDSRCKLLQFQGCLNDASSQVALAGLVARAQRNDAPAKLSVTLTNPRQHQLAELRLTHHVLDVRARPVPGDRCPCPLPTGPIRSPTLIVVCDQATEESEVTNLILDLAPENKRFHALGLRRWQGKTFMLKHSTIAALATAGILTPNSAASVPEYDIASNTISGHCEVCDERHSAQNVGLCLKLDLPENWTAANSSDIETVTKLLKHLHPPKLTIIPDKSQKWTPVLGDLLKVVPQEHRGHLVMILSHSYWKWSPADVVMLPFSSAQCQVTILAACLETAASHEILVPILQRSADTEVPLFISLTKPRQHNLTVLTEVKHRMEVRALQDITEDCRDCRPLPLGTRRPPSLTVVCTPTEGVGGVSDLIMDLAPTDKRYRGLALELKHQFTAQEIEDILTALMAAGVHTDQTSGKPRWAHAEYNDVGRCQVCDERKNNGHACLRLWLPLAQPTPGTEGREDTCVVDDFLELQELSLYLDVSLGGFISALA